jgi:predicted Fe-Mo cluster-binding NifX family protein
MKIAFAQWDARIAPVFDTAQRIQIVETASGQVIGKKQADLPETHLLQKALRLVELEIDTLVCGAISRPMHGLIAAYGIQVIPFVTGSLDAVIQAWRQGSLSHEMYVMPGCRGWGRQRFRGRQRKKPTRPPYKNSRTRR